MALLEAVERAIKLNEWIFLPLHLNPSQSTIKVHTVKSVASSLLKNLCLSKIFIID